MDRRPGHPPLGVLPTDRRSGLSGAGPGPTEAACRNVRSDAQRDRFANRGDDLVSGTGRAIDIARCPGIDHKPVGGGPAHGGGGECAVSKTAQDTEISVREGDDEIHGLGGNDTLEGLLGDDKLYGGAGNDKLIGAGGKNDLFEDAN